MQEQWNISKTINFKLNHINLQGRGQINKFNVLRKLNQTRQLTNNNKTYQDIPTTNDWRIKNLTNINISNNVQHILSLDSNFS